MTPTTNAWTVTCDRCNRILRDQDLDAPDKVWPEPKYLSGYEAEWYKSTGGAERMARLAGWTVNADSHLCPDCAKGAA